MAVTIQNIHKSIEVVELVALADHAHTGFYSDAVSVRGNDAVELLAIQGTFTGEDTSNYLTITVEEADMDTDMSVPESTDFSAVAAADLSGAFLVVNGVAATDSDFQRVGYIGIGDYVRLKYTYTSTGVSASNVTAYAILDNPKRGPALDSDDAIDGLTTAFTAA